MIPAALGAALAGARRVVVLTGAGVSAESGIPTFRDALTGLWARFDPLELATPAAFARNPKLVWDWYAERRAAVLAAMPNAGHLALATIERRVPAFLLATVIGATLGGTYGGALGDAASARDSGALAGVALGVFAVATILLCLSVWLGAWIGGCFGRRVDHDDEDSP